MNLRQLEVFYAIMQAGTVSGAAKNLHVSQPNVTRVLAHTEQQLGFTLFERVKGRLVPTLEANTLLPEVENIYRQLNQFRVITNKVKQGHQHIRIGAPPVLASHLLTPIIAAFYQSHTCSIDLTTGNRNELCDALLNNELDIAIAFGDKTPAGISHELLTKTAMRILLPRLPCQSLIPADKHPINIPLELLLQQDIAIIALDNRDPLGDKLSQAIANIDSNHAPSITVRNYSAGAELAKLGAGIAIVDPWTAAQYQHCPELYVAELNTPLDCSVSLMTSDLHPLSITSKQFLQQLRQYHTVTQ
ncbi:LysR family transcriptional regulator [Vibrio cionasavignyae]|uniref:LysR family transcriptional regulator n=1 Tax=Vibrio cionasavignyae TaxID=2910252 RepID=UPI003D09C4D8